MIFDLGVWDNLGLGLWLWLIWLLTGQFADKPTRGQSSGGLVNSQTSQLVDSKVFLNDGKIITYLYTKPNTNPNPVDY